MTIKNMAKAVGLEENYEVVYQLLCDHTHSNVISILRQFKQGATTDSIRLAPVAEGDQAPFVAAAWFSHILSICDQALETGKQKEIETLQSGLIR